MIILKVVLLSVFIGTLLYANKKYVPYGSRVKRELVPQVFFPRGEPISIETILARKEEIKSRPYQSSRHDKRLHGLCECWECNDTCPYFRECYKRDSVKKVASFKCMETCKNKDCEKHGGYTVKDVLRKNGLAIPI